MRIPHTLLSAEALQPVIEEFVTHDGTDHSPVEHRIATVLSQLDAGRLELHFDEVQSGQFGLMTRRSDSVDLQPLASLDLARSHLSKHLPLRTCII